MAFHLYRHFDADDRLLYVGVSLSTVHRLGQHKDHSHWFEKITKITIERFDSREESLDAETAAIQFERPLYNIVHRKSDPEMEAAMKSRFLLMRQVAFRPMYDIKAAAECLDLSKIAVRGLISSGKLGAFKLGEPGKEKTYVSGWQIIDFLESIIGKVLDRDGGDDDCEALPRPPVTA